MVLCKKRLYHKVSQRYHKGSQRLRKQVSRSCTEKAQSCTELQYSIYRFTTIRVVFDFSQIPLSTLKAVKL